MALKLYFHPLSSYCHKALIPLYETGAAFEPIIVDLMDPDSRAAFLKVWPVGKFPVIQDEQGRVIPESTIIVEYLAERFPKAGLIPTDPERARETRLRDRFFDCYVHSPMQQAVGHVVMRPADQKDPFGLKQVIGQIRKAYGLIEQGMIAGTWAMGEDFTLADCAAAPALFYADKVTRIGPEFPRTAAYLDRLMKRPSYARTLKEAEPYLQHFPVKEPLG